MSAGNGGPAFPNTLRIDDEAFASLRGMTLRDYFAAKAMQAYVQAGFSLMCQKFENNTDEINPTYASASYELADAMLKARTN